MNGADSIDRAALERFRRGESADAYRLFGNQRCADGQRRFTVWAPNAAAVALEGDFNGWQGAAMERLDCGAWTLTAAAAQGDIYKYIITDRAGHSVEKADPYAFHFETAPANGSRVWDIGAYVWHDADYLARRGAREPVAAPMSIYEVHLGSWRAPEPGAQFPNYSDMAVQLAAYCREMGYTHVELLPVTEYPYAPSWGYQVTGYFAPTSRYGTPQDFMRFVDTLHGAGIGVLMDWVPAHFARDSHGLAAFDGTPVYERADARMASHPDWGTLIFDYEAPAVRSLLKSSACLFLDEYHIDGIRMDAVSSMLYLNFGRGDNFVPNRLGGSIDLGAVSLLRELNALIRERGCISIAEESSAYPRVTAPPEEDGLGFTFKWDMGFMHDTLEYFALDPARRGEQHEKLTFSMLYAFSEHFILAFSHDEVVHGKKSMLDKMSGGYDEKFAGLRALFGFQFAHPGKKLTFMGSDFGQFIEWNDGQALDWFLLDYPRHAELRRWVRELNRFYAAQPALWERDDGWEGFTWLSVDDAARCAVALLRTAADGGRIACACNFSARVTELPITLPVAGTLTLLLSSDEPRFGGAGTEVPARIGGAASLTLPPLSCSYYRFEEADETWKRR